jgi:hypothetical protein
LPLSREYWYLVSSGNPPDESVNVTFSLSKTLSIGVTERLSGVDPTMDVLVEEDLLELGDVHAGLETARKINT